ncbi:MAG: sulfatase-like hydrolase/transferase [Oscillospiraceae bacterium]|nr:sulfatase-like hydrolase/transferase [Oscillospiraceae bacterium]
MKVGKLKHIPKISLPAWLLLPVMTVWCETLFHLWTTEAFVFSRLAGILLFALAIGAVLGLISSFFPGKAGKWVAFGLSCVLLILYIAEFLMNDAFKSFMGMGAVRSGAGGVASDYLDVVLIAILKNLWRWILFLLPAILYAVFCQNIKTNWIVWVALPLLAALLCGSALGVIYTSGLDSAKLKDDYSFDPAVRSFGVGVALIMDTTHGSGSGETDISFEAVELPPAVTVQQPEPAPAPTPALPAEEQTEAGLPAEEEAPEEPEEEPFIPQPHTLGLDFAAMAEAETNPNIAALHSYVASQTPQMENEYTGLFAGKNLIFITAEAFCGMKLDPELMPTLYRMATEGIHFTDFYQPVWGAGTTGGEYSNVVGQIPVDGFCMNEAVQQNLFFTMGKQLQAQGYSSAAFHNNTHDYYDRDKTHPLLGYEYFMGYGNGMEEGLTNCWPRSDVEMFDFTLPLYIDQQPFSVYYMTVSAHAQYEKNSNAMSRKHYDLVKDLEYSDAIRCFLACNMEVEYSMNSLLAQLEEAGILEDTVIVISPDHYPYGLAPSTTWGSGADYLFELFGQSALSKENIRDQNGLIIWSPCLEDMDLVIDTPVSSLDILPTLSNLFGLPYDSRLFVGRDVFSEQMPLVIWGVTASWKTELGFYDASTGKFTPTEGAEIPDGYVDTVNAMVRNIRKFSKGTADHDYWNVLDAALTGTE